MRYVYKNNTINSLHLFLRDNGTKYVLFWYDGMGEDELLILDGDEKTFSDLYLSHNKDVAFISNINTNSFLSLKDFFIPYKRNIPPTNVPFHIERMYHQVDFVTFNFRDNVLIIERDENGFKDKVNYSSLSVCFEKTGLKKLGPHVILRNNKNKEIFEPLYDVKNKTFYLQGSKLISPINIFDD